MFPYKIDNVEEEKEIKNLKPHEAKLKDFRKFSSITSSQKFDIEIGLENNTDSKMAKQHEEIKEDVKGDVNKEEFKKSCEERNSICGMKRAKSFNHREELERSLKDFTCTICMEYMVGARQLQCGHCFCDQCISFWFLREKVCPICRDRVREEKTIDCNLIDFTIEHMLVRSHYKDSTIKKEISNWHKRRQKYIKWKESHKISKCKIGDKIDVRDTEYIWCVGTVEKILKSKYNCANLLYIHYEGWNRCYDEYIPADSDRISPLRLYTSRTDIPKYTRHDGPEDRVYGNVVEDGERVSPPINAVESSDSDAENNNDNQENLNNEENIEDIVEENQDENINLPSQEEIRNEQQENNLEQNTSQQNPQNALRAPCINLNQLRPPSRPSSERLMSRISVPLRSTSDTLLSLNRLLNARSLLQSPPFGVNNRNTRDSDSRERQENESNSSAQNQSMNRQNENSG